MLNFRQTWGRSILSLPCIPYTDWLILKRFKHRHAARKWYQVLGVAEDCEDETLRLAFVHLAKKFHPDGGTQDADATRFSEVENAYRQICKIRNKEKDKEALEVEEFDIKHTAPQHRHYLMYDVGVGTVHTRQRLYTVQRAQKAAENVMEHRLQKLQAEERNTLVGMDKERAKDVKTRFGMDRLVEDLIQEAMNKGEFSDLKGMGKPLKENLDGSNPHVDFVTHKLNQILIENGFTPEWIQLSKEIREDVENLRRDLAKARNEVGYLPLNSSDEISWQSIIGDFRPTSQRINKKIDKYNLLVPILQKQMVHINLEILANEALSVPPVKVVKEKSRIHDSSADQQMGVLDAIASILSGKNT